MFSTTDYVVFGLSMGSFVAIGIYYGFKGILWSKKQEVKSNRDFLTGASDHRIIYAGLSIFAAFISPLTMIGIPLVTYWGGMQYFVTILTFAVAITFMNFVVVPIFVENQFKTGLQYVIKRFDKTVFTAALVLYVVSSVTTMGVWISVPARALVQLSGLPFFISVTIASAVVIFYAAFGGMRAILFADLVQILVMSFSIISVIVKGTVRLGGIRSVFLQNQVAGRKYFDWDPNPFTEKATTWTIFIGNCVYWTMTYGTSQAVLNRYQPASDLSKARRILWLQIPLMATFYFLCLYFGLVLYASYRRCDPFLTERVYSSEGFVPLFVGDIGGHVPGFSGIFMTGVFSGSLSSVAAVLNGLATVANEHILQKFMHHHFSRSGLKIFLRLVAVGIGILIIPLAFATRYIENSLKLRILVANTFSCPTFAVYLLGFFNPRAESKGTLIGLICGTLMGIWLMAAHYLEHRSTFAAGVSVDYCPEFYCEQTGLSKNDTACLNGDFHLVKPDSPLPTASSFTDKKWVFKLSHQLGGFATIFVTVLIGSLCSFCFKLDPEKREESQKYLVKCLRKSSKKAEEADENESKKEI